MDQQADGGSWQLLGTFSFEVVAHSVSLSDNPDGVVIAGAIKPMQVVSDYAHYISEREATIVRYLGSGRAVAIPSMLGWYPVVSLQDEYSTAGMAIGAFERCATLTSIRGLGLRPMFQPSFWGSRRAIASQSLHRCPLILIVPPSIDVFPRRSETMKGRPCASTPFALSTVDQNMPILEPDCSSKEPSSISRWQTGQSMDFSQTP